MNIFDFSWENYEKGPSNATGSWLFRRDDISDWPSFILKLNQDANKSSPNPGKRVWCRLNPKSQCLIKNSTANTNISKEEKSVIVKSLNDLLECRNFFKEQYFSDLIFPEEVQELLNRDKEELSTNEVKKLNRLLIGTAYPQEIKEIPSRYWLDWEDYEKARAQPLWDIENLREFFYLGDQLAPGKDIIFSNMLFPSDLVTSITEDQVSSLQLVFDVPESDRYSWWRHTYFEVNWRYKLNGWTQKAEIIACNLRKIVPTGDLPEVFFLLAYSSLLNDKKETQFKARDSNLWTQFNKRAQTNAETIEKVINQLVHIVDLTDKEDANGYSKLMLPKVAEWFKEHQFKELLPELLKVVKKDRQESQDAFERIYKSLKENFPSNRVETTPEVVYRAFDTVSTLMGKAKGLKNRDVKGALFAFSLWGIAIDEEAEKNSRWRRKKR